MAKSIKELNEFCKKYNLAVGYDRKGNINKLDGWTDEYYIAK